MTDNLFSRQGSRATSILVFLFLATLLSTRSGYSYALGALVLYSLWQVMRSPSISLQRSEAWILLWLLLFAVFGMSAAAIHGDPLAEYEVPIKFALAVVLIVCCMKLPPKPAFFWLGLVTGAVSGFFVAYWKMEQSGIPKAFGYTGAIQFGNLALTLSLIQIVGLCWLLSHRSKDYFLWLAALPIGTFFGLLSSYFSGTRGGWVAIPVFLILFLLSYVRRQNFFYCFLVVMGIVLSGAIIVISSTMVQERIQAAANDVVEYQSQGFESVGSIGSRLAIWEVSLDMLKDKPVWGWGEVKFRAELKRREQDGRLGAVPASLANTHNTFIEVWMMYGGLALIALIGLLISLTWYFLRYVRCPDSVMRAYSLAGLCLVMGYVVYGQSQIMLIRNNTLVFFLLMIAVLMGMLRQRRIELEG
ncbi:O-antigen ligase family protein [Alcaligenes aquatilis]|nr:O-antigen ligase family protein [Alcaligenes aquatilis]